MVLAHNTSQGLRTQDIHISENVTFETMLLCPITLQGLKNAGFCKPSPVQLHGIPLGKCGFDVLLEAKSGTGKTAVFTVIALEKLDLRKGLQTIILAPTREIAAQISDVIKQIGSFYKNLSVEVVMGGLSVQEDILKFQKTVHIVVGSPGRLKHLIKDKHIDTSAVRLLVLDEADKLMEKSFQKDIKYIFSILPKQKQVIMSSATYPDTSKSFINNYLQSAQHVCPNSNSVLLGVEQKITVVKCNSNIVRQTKLRFDELIKILTKRQFKQCLIFCNYQVRVGEVYEMLTKEKWPAEQLYGKQEQTVRLGALKTLQEYKCRILIATDLAARGIDASNVDLVINFEPPYEWQTYLHRIGRAGRFGSYGMAVSILSDGEEKNRFKELLGGMNFTFDLHNIWSGEKFNLTDKSQTIKWEENNMILPKKENIIFTVNSQELWYSITNENVDGESNVNEIDDFNNLCKSFEKSVMGIDSFADLLSSFHNNIDLTNEDNIEYPYKNITFKKICKGAMETKELKDQVIIDNLRNNQHNTTPQIGNDIPIKTNLNEIENTSAVDMKYNAPIDNCYTKLVETELIKSNSPNNSLLTSKSKVKNVHNQKEKVGHEASNTLNQTNTYDNLNKNVYDLHNEIHVETNDIKRALIEAGLPTSFQSSKKNHKHEKVNVLRRHENTEQEREVIHNRYYNKIPNKLNPNLYESSVMAKNITTLKNNCHTKPNASKCFYEKKLHNHISKHDLKSPNKMKNPYTVNNGIKHDVKLEYDMWYNQLKSHTKQVEYLIYFEEMSNL